MTKSDFILKVSLLIKTCKFCSFHERHKKANIIVCMVKQFCWQWCVRKHTWRCFLEREEKNSKQAGPLETTYGVERHYDSFFLPLSDNDQQTPFLLEIMSERLVFVTFASSIEWQKQGQVCCLLNDYLLLCRSCNEWSTWNSTIWRPSYLATLNCHVIDLPSSSLKNKKNGVSKQT